MQSIYLFLTKLSLRLHNLLYKLSSRLAIKTEGGLHPKHRLMNYHQFFIDNVCEEDIVLDIGCGNGALASDIAKKAQKIVAIDLSPQNIDSAKRNYPANNIDYLVGDATRFDFNGEFDIIILSNVLEHIQQRTDFLNKIKQLAPKILIRVPMLDREWIALYKKDLGVEWRLDKTHCTEYTLSSFSEELRGADLTLQEHSIQFGEIWGSVLTGSSTDKTSSPT